jgi:hypothetical protein
MTVNTEAAPPLDRITRITPNLRFPAMYMVDDGHAHRSTNYARPRLVEFWA